MRKGLIYAVLLTAALMVSDGDAELAKMKPVETVSIRYLDGLIAIETDTEDIGVGKTVEEALANLEETTAGRIFLDTAAFLLIEAEAEDQVYQMASLLKGSARICERKGEIDMKTVGEYLRAHTPELKLKNWRKGMKLQTLETENGRLKIS